MYALVIHDSTKRIRDARAIDRLADHEAGSSSAGPPRCCYIKNDTGYERGAALMCHARVLRSPLLLYCFLRWNNRVAPELNCHFFSRG